MDEQRFLQPECVLFLVAHPDDPEFFAAGTVARWTSGGARVVYVIVTGGDKGSNDAAMTSEQLKLVRQAEQRAAAQSLGVAQVTFLDYLDGEVYNTPALRCDLVRQIRLHRPDLVVTHDPTARFIGQKRINHPDHIAVGNTALDAVFPLARDRFNFPEHQREGLAPHKVLNVLMMMTNQANEWVDIGATLDSKIAALQEHRSQVGDLATLAERTRQRARDWAEGTPYTYAERFRRVSLKR